MKKLIFLFAVSAILVQCKNEPANSGVVDQTADTLQNETPKEPTKQPCTLVANILPGNERWLREAGVVVCVLADSTTKDRTLGDSHRILEVIQTDSCRSIFRKVLPVDHSPDFNYQIADILYNKVTQVVAIKSFSQVQCYDVSENKMLPTLKPAFYTKRAAADAQSGMIKRLEVWEDYLLGFAVDYGAFIFDLADKNNPKPVLPVAEYRLDDETFASLFLLDSRNGSVEQQAIIPEYDAENDKFKIQPVFQSLTPVNPDIQKSAKNNRFVVLRNKEQKTAVAIDMQNQTEVSLPENLAKAQTKEILKWLASAGK